MGLDRVEFVYDGLADEQIRAHGTFLAELRCACGCVKLTESLFCERCGRTSSVVLLHRRDVWMIYLGETSGVPLDVLRCPHCDQLVSRASRYCDRGARCLLGVVGVVVVCNRSGVFELHRCIHPDRNRDAFVLPSGVVMMCELPPFMKPQELATLLFDKQTTPVIEPSEAEVHQEVHHSDSPKILAHHILQTTFIFEETAHISRSELYDIYVLKVGEIAPQTHPLSRQDFFGIVRQVVPDVDETHRRVGGKLQRFFKGIGLAALDR